MARINNGLFGTVKGKIGNIVVYNLNGQTVCRTIGEVSQPSSDKQLNNRQQMKVLTNFFRKIKELLRTGFNPIAENSVQNFHNLAMAYNKPHALKGFYPEVAIDFEKFVFSIGELEPPLNPSVELKGETLKFYWEPNGNSSTSRNDQVMLLVYAPETQIAIYTNSGARRHEGMDELSLPSHLLQEQLEIYISFVSDNRKQAANSLYMGSFKF